MYTPVVPHEDVFISKMRDYIYELYDKVECFFFLPVCVWGCGMAFLRYNFYSLHRIFFIAKGVRCCYYYIGYNVIDT